MSERPEVPAARLPGRRPRAVRRSRRRRKPHRTGRTRWSPPHLAGRPEDHQHAGLPRGRPLLAVRQPGVVGHRHRDALPALRHGPPRVLAVRLVRSGQPVRVHGSGADRRVSPKNTRNTCTLFCAADDGRARNDDAAQPTTRGRRSTTCSSSRRNGTCSQWHCSEQDRQTVRSHLADITSPVTAALLHPDHRRPRHRPHRAGRCSTRSSA